MTPYRPSGKSDPGALPVLLLASLGAGVAAGLVLHLVGSFIHLLIIWPAIMGGAAGATAAMLVKRRRVRAPVVAALAAAVGGLGAWTTDLALGYPEQLDAVRGQVRAVAEQLEASGEVAIDSARIDTTANALLVEYGEGRDPTVVSVSATLLGEPVEREDGTFQPLPERGPAEAFVGWVKLQARAGTTISRTGSTTGGTELGYGGTLVLWLVELLIAVGLAAFLAATAAKEPFCESCNAWYADEELMLPVAPESERRAVLEALDRGDATAIPQLLSAVGLSDRYLVLAGRRCTACGSAPAHVRLVRVRETKNKTEQKELKRGLLSIDVFDAVVAELERAATPADAPAEGQPA